MTCIDDATLLKMAEAELLGEAKRAAVRHSIAGVSGWQKVPRPNKMFLTNTLLQTMASNRLLLRKKGEKNGSASKHKKSERKLLQKNCKNKSNNFVFQKPKENKHRTEDDNMKNSKCRSNKIVLKDKKLFRKVKGEDKCEREIKVNKK